MTINSIDVAINGRFLELPAKGQILPGMLLEYYEDGVRPHSVEGGTAPPLIAIENRFKGTDIHTPYEIGNTVYIRYCLSGDVFWGRFSPYTPGYGEFLSSSGALSPGSLKEIDPLPLSGAIVGREIEEGVLINSFYFVKVEVL